MSTEPDKVSLRAALRRAKGVVPRVPLPDRRGTEELLDTALDHSFPASDPVAIAVDR